MLRKTVSGMTLILLFLSMLTLALNIQLVKAEPTTIIVPDDYPTIQEAINNANEGDKIFARSGTYYEHVFVNKTVSLIGEDKETTLIDGNGSIVPIIRIFAPNVTFSGFTVRNTPSDWPTSGIFVRNTQHVNIVNNTVEEAYYGILLQNSSYSKVSDNIIMENFAWGAVLQICATNNLFTSNVIMGNPTGVDLSDPSCQNNIFYHNNFINNTNQVGNAWGINTKWDSGYPSGGNYWSDYNGTDLFSGLHQNETGSDGIGDTPYVIATYGNNTDYYPLMNPWTPTPPTPPVVTATVDIHPQALNLRSRGKWITAYIELPEGYHVNDVNVSSIMLNGTIPVEPKPIAIGDYDNNSIPDLMVKFNRAQIIEYIKANVNMTQLFKERFMTITLTITGYLNDDTPFQGSDIIRIIMHMGGAGRHNLRT